MQALELSEVRRGTHAHVDDAVAALYERDGAVLVGLAMRAGLTSDEAADVVQEAHVRLWTELRRGKVIDDRAAWTSRVVYRLAMDHHRFRRRLRQLTTRLQPAPIRDPAELSRGHIWMAVDRLPPRERAAVYLRYRADLDFDRIATAMGISPGAARMYVSRGLAKLRAQVNPED